MFTADNQSSAYLNRPVSSMGGSCTWVYAKSGDGPPV